MLVKQHENQEVSGYEENYISMNLKINDKTIKGFPHIAIFIITHGIIKMNYVKVIND